MIEFRMPSLGADMEHGVLREWRKQPGDVVRKGDIIADVETQKGIIEVEIFEDGVIGQLLVKEDEKVPVGTVMALIQTDVPLAAEKPETMEIEQVPAAKKSVIRPAPRVRISPLAKRIAEEKGIDPLTVKGSGEDGAITKADIENAAGAADIRSAVPSYTGASKGMRAAVAAAMSRSNREIPHYYLEIKADMSKALDMLATMNVDLPVQKRVLPVALFIKAVANALREVPELNAVWENELVLKKNINVGLVISLRGGGIMVPSIHEADRKSPAEIMEALSELTIRARVMKLRSSELSETTVTVTSLGDNGAEAVSGMIYPPQVALIGFGAISEQAWAENSGLFVRPVARITLAADHRASDGHTGSRLLEHIRRQLLEPWKL
jgi:pyruvate dehydrogenase E2 component (dihydrolipoamide acetyltransferase)